jgi:cell wall assembly regulator SMI1
VLADTLKELAGRRLTDRDGDTTVLELLPPATDAEISALEASLPGPLPDEVRAALRISTGLANGPLESVSLLDLAGFGLEEAFPHAYSIAHDGCGNFWILDLLPGSSVWGPVFYACHDPPVIAYQAPTVEAFLRDVVATEQAGPRSPVDEVHEDVVARIWREHPDLIAQPTAADSGDPMLRDFASALPATAMIADLRRPQLGQGFAWGRFGPRTLIERFRTERLWALTPPVQKPGLFARLFGR